MKRMSHFRTCAAALAAAILLSLAQGDIRVHAQNRMTFSIVQQDLGHVALGLAVRKLTVSGTFMQAPAHPDDETNALFALFGHGMGLRSIDVQNNRGEGGQNEIGPELFRDIGGAAHLRAARGAPDRRRGAVFHARHRLRLLVRSRRRSSANGAARRSSAITCGSSARCGRTWSLTMNIQGRGGDRAHEATTILVREAYRAAGDPAMYPEQIREGLRPWQPKKLYFTRPGCRRGPRRAVAGRARQRSRPPATARRRPRR